MSTSVYLSGAESLIFHCRVELIIGNSVSHSFYIYVHVLDLIFFLPCVCACMCVREINISVSPVVLSSWSAWFSEMKCLRFRCLMWVTTRRNVHMYTCFSGCTFSFQAFLASKACLPSVLSHLLICVSSLNRSEIDLFAIWFQTAHP